jgi:alpha 1,3-glucosidase
MRDGTAAAPSWRRAAVGILSILALLPSPAVAVKHHDFKTCAQSGFCKRNRAYADDALAQASSWAAPYAVDPESARFADGQLRATVLKSIGDGEMARLPLTVSFQQSGSARFTLDEERRQKGDIELRHGSTARKERYNEAQDWVVVGGLDVDAAARVIDQSDKRITIAYGPDAAFEAVVTFTPLSVDFRRDGATQVRFNGRGLLNMEHWRSKIDPPKVEEEKKEGEGAGEGGAKDPAEDTKNTNSKPLPDQSTWWDETFGGNTDSKPRGPESVGLDISFPGYEHVFGIPSHATALSLKETRGGGDHAYSEPYRLFNADVFEYITDSPMTLYGSIPFMQAHRKDSTVGVFWLNAAETWVDVTKAKESANPLALGIGARTSTHTHWFSEAGLLDVFVFLGPTPRHVTDAYGELTGYTAMPQEFALGYHQCRWNYVSDDDVREVDRKMDKFSIPYDVIWLDIEYTDDKKYFTWHPDMFADPVGMGEQLDAHGRKLVVIIDPHIKNVDYPVSKDMKARGLAVTNKDGKPYDGWCWPGSSNWLDAFNPAARTWWASLFRYDAFKGTLANTWIWNDMNEPSVFNGPETTMPRDNLHHGGWEHRDVHNLNGMTFHNLTADGIEVRADGETRRRPFVLTRSFFAGSQRLGAMWTGDNQASWEHLQAGTPMILSQGVAGFPFAGADVGGFFGNPDRELLVRWYQAGAFYPFFRGHAHIDARRREPYLLGPEHTPLVTAALRLRYSLLPAFYTAFFHAHRDGSPILRPMFWTHPAAEAGFALDDQYFVGSTGLLSKPVVREGQDAVDVWIPDAEVYYDYWTYLPQATKAGKHATLAAPLDKIPLLMRGGHVFPRRDIARRSSALMRWDDYTLVVAVGRDGTAEGELYVDDGETYDFADGQYIHRRFTLARDGTFSSADADNSKDPAAPAVAPGEWMAKMRAVHIDRVVLVGAPKAWSEVEVVGEQGKTWRRPVEHHPADAHTGAFAVVGGLGVGVGETWTARFM